MGLVSLPTSGVWDVLVLLDGADVSQRLTGRARIEAEEGAARIAEFTLLPMGGAIALTAWVGAPVTIDVIQDATAHRLFTGIVDHPRYDPATRQVTLSCTDARQEKLDTLDAAAIAALVPGALWSPDVFDAEADGLRQAEDRLSTLPASLDLALDGATWLLTPWAAKPTPDHVFEAVLDESLSVEVAERRSLVNEVAVELDYRFTRQRHRERNFQWAWSWPPGTPSDFCAWFTDTTELPDKDMIQRAAEGGGWGPYPTSYSWTELPPSSGPPVCGNFSVGWINPGVPVVLGASWTAARRMTQAVTEQYRLTVRSPQSIARHGVVTGRERSVAYTEFDSGDWERQADQGRPEGAVQDALEDWIVDHADRDQCNLAIETLLAMARTRILAAHRRNYVSWQWPGVVPGLDRADTVRVSGDDMDAEGKVVQLLTEIDFTSASLLTTVRIAVSRSGTEDPVSETPLLAPAPPDTTPEPPPGDDDDDEGGIVLE